MAERVQVAFLGIDNPHGHGWRELLRSFESELAITALVPGFAGSLTSLEERLVDVPRFATADELIADAEFDAAFIGLSNDEAPGAIVKLAEAGKHVLAEKPVAGSADAARAIVEAVRRRGVVFQCGYMWRYDECANRLRDMVADGRFGKHISTEITFVTSDVRRRDPNHYLFEAEVSTSGFFNWLGCHSLDLLLYILGQAVVGVTARSGVFGATDIDVEDGGVAFFDLADGSLATFLGGYWLPRWAGEFRWCTRGSERWVHWEPTRPGTSGAFEIHGPKPQWIAMEETFTTPPDETPGYGGIRGKRLVRDWLDAIADGGRDCRNTPESMRATLELIDAMYESSRQQQRIECDIGGPA